MSVMSAVCDGSQDLQTMRFQVRNSAEYLNDESKSTVKARSGLLENRIGSLCAIFVKTKQPSLTLWSGSNDRSKSAFPKIAQFSEKSSPVDRPV